MWYLKQGEGNPRPIITPKRFISIVFIQRQIRSYMFMISKMYLLSRERFPSFVKVRSCSVTIQYWLYILWRHLHL